MSCLESFNQKADAVLKILESAILSAEHGQLVDVSSLDQEALALQQAAVALPDTDKPKAQEKIAAVLDAMNRLSLELQKHASLLKGELQQTASTSAASKAYLKASKKI